MWRSGVRAAIAEAATNAPLLRRLPATFAHTFSPSSERIRCQSLPPGRTPGKAWPCTGYRPARVKSLARTPSRCFPDAYESPPGGLVAVRMTTRPRLFRISLYHSIWRTRRVWIAPFAVTPAAFEHHVDLIISSGRNPITVSSLCAALGGQSSMAPRPVVITFDDGFADFADAAAVLGRHQIPSTLYVTTGALRGRGPRPPEMAIPPASMLHWSQLAELELSNVEIGAHTHTHRQLDIMRTKEVADELRHSKEILEDELGHQVLSFAYPHGFHCSRIRRVVATVGHTSAGAVMNALSSQRDDPFSLARLTIRPNTTPTQICEWLDGRGARIAPYREPVRTKAWRVYRRARGPRSARGVIDLSANTY